MYFAAINSYGKSMKGQAWRQIIKKGTDKNSRQQWVVYTKKLGINHDIICIKTK